MRFRCNSRELLEAVQTVIRVMAVRSPMEILEGVLLDADVGGITVTASDGTMTSVYRVNAEVETDGSAILPGRLLGEVVRKLPDGELDVSLSNKFVLTIKCQGSRFNISGRSAEEFPVPSDEGFLYDVSLPQPLLKEMIRQTAFAVPMEDQRVVLTGGYLNMYSGNIDMVGLDGFRMAIRSAVTSDTQTQAKAIIPCKALDEIAKLMSDDEDKLVNLSFGRNRLLVENGVNKFYTSLIEGEYIEYRRVIPKAFNLTATVDRQQFCDCIERAALIARTSRNNLIKFEIGENMIVLSATSDTGDVREELDARTEGGELTISFNVKYLTELSRVISGDEIVLKFGTSVTPCVITPVEGEEFTYLVLPVRTNA